MPCNCKGKSPLEIADKKTVRELARRYQKKHGGIIVFYHCTKYDFTEYENFIDDENKTEIEYII